MVGAPPEELGGALDGDGRIGGGQGVGGGVSAGGSVELFDELEGEESAAGEGAVGEVGGEATEEEGFFEARREGRKEG